MLLRAFLLPALLAGLWLLPGRAGAQVTLAGTVRDSLTQQPLPFASVFLAGTTLGATTTEQGQFTLTGVPAGSYELVASYVGYRLARHRLAVAAGQLPVSVLLAPEASALAEVVVRARRHVNRAADYQRFVEQFLGQTSFSRQCAVRNPQAVVVDYDARARVLTASAPDFVEVENQALGYRIKYYGLRFQADFAQQVVTFYGQPVFAEMTPRNARQQQRWQANRARAYHGSLTHFLRSVYAGRVAAEGFVAQRLRLVPNPGFARADGLRRQLLRRPSATYSGAEQDSLARWARVPPRLLLLYTAPRPPDSLRRVAADGRVFLRFRDDLQVSYLPEQPDPLYPGPTGPLGGGPAPGPRRQVSRLALLQPEVELQANGQPVNPLALFTENYWGFEKVGEFLPLNYDSPPSHPE